MSGPTTRQSLITRRSSRFGPDKVYVLERKEDGLEIGVVHADETKDRLLINPGDILDLGGEKWQVMDTMPWVSIPTKEDTTTQPTAITLLQLLN